MIKFINNSRIVFKSNMYTACAMRDGSLIVTKNKTQEGRRMVGDNAPYWVENFEDVIDTKEGNALCKALFI